MQELGHLSRSIETNPTLVSSLGRGSYYNSNRTKLNTHAKNVFDNFDLIKDDEFKLIGFRRDPINYGYHSIQLLSEKSNIFYEEYCNWNGYRGKYPEEFKFILHGNFCDILNSINNDSPLYSIKFDFKKQGDSTRLLFSIKFYINTDLIDNILKNEFQCISFNNLIAEKYAHICKSKDLTFNILKEKSIIPYSENSYELKLKSGFKLFEYQKKSISKMIDLESNKIDYDFSPIVVLDFCGYKINYDPIINKINKKSSFSFTTNGGILADEMGLGKTITSLSLIEFNESDYKGPVINYEYSSLNCELIGPRKILLQYTKATLILTPAHLINQWLDEAKKIFKKKKIIKIITKKNHEKLTIKDIKDADIIFVSFEFIFNFSYYPKLILTDKLKLNITPSSGEVGFKKRLAWIYDNLINLKPTDMPLLEYFYFHRIIIDEGHEIMEHGYKDYHKSNYLNQFIKHCVSKNKWFVSGTPFSTYSGFFNIINFLNINFKYRNKKSYLNISDGVFSNTQYERLLDNVCIRNKKSDVTNEVNLPGSEEEIIWINLSEIEKNIYNSKKGYYGKDILQQICCHPLVAESYKNMFNSNKIVDLDQIEAQMKSFHVKQIETYTKKLMQLDQTNQAYHMLKANYTSKVTESKYILKVLDSINTTIENEDTDCVICLDKPENPVLTECGHLYCKECISMALKVNKKCPMCKHVITGELISIDKSQKVKKKEENPFIKKYGSKLGKLILMIKTLICNENNRIIVFSQWDRMLNLISKSLLENDIENSFIKGNVYTRNAAIAKFKSGINTQGDPNRVIMLSLKNTASGTNLTEATHIFFVEPINCAPGKRNAIELQAIGRACRIGQKNKVKIIRILTKNTIEEEIYNSCFKSSQINI